jgi:hypothetical protein
MKVNQVLDLLEELEREVKGHDFEVDAAGKKVNSSFVILAVQALRAYLQGEEASAAEDFETLGVEIRARQELRSKGDNIP